MIIRTIAAKCCAMLFVLLWQPYALAKPHIVTTTTTLGALIRPLVGDVFEVSTIARGVQDPHYVEAKPSYMIKVRKADLLVAVGLELEAGWLPNIQRGARNPKNTAQWISLCRCKHFHHANRRNNHPCRSQQGRRAPCRKPALLFGSQSS